MLLVSSLLRSDPNNYYRIECGIVKVPRVPVDDDAMVGDYEYTD